MMRKLGLIFIIFSWGTILPSKLKAGPQASLEEGNSHFEKGEYDEAVESYSRLTRQNFESAELFYNLGNTYFRKGERGKAALWYERALRLDPRDSDIAFNLQLSRSHLKDNARSAMETVIFYFTDRELGATVLILIWISFGLLFVRLMGWGNSETISKISLIFGSLFLISGILFGIRSYQNLQPLAVVMSPPGEVRNGPGLDYPVGFTVPEGTRVIVLKKRLDWWQVGVADQGLKGWMPTSQVEMITSETLS